MPSGVPDTVAVVTMLEGVLPLPLPLPRKDIGNAIEGALLPAVVGDAAEGAAVEAGAVAGEEARGDVVGGDGKRTGAVASNGELEDGGEMRGPSPWQMATNTAPLSVKQTTPKRKQGIMEQSQAKQRSH